MDQSSASTLRIGAWRVDLKSSQISSEGETLRVESRAMGLLLCLARRAGETVTIDELLNEVWSGVVVTPDSVYQAIASLRRLLRDDPKSPSYIMTVPRLGYRMIANVGAWVDESPQPAAKARTTEAPKTQAAQYPRRRVVLVGAGTVLLLALAATVLFLRERSGAPAVASAVAAHTTRSVAVLAFLDLTDQMDEEPFADGITEELVDRLSRVPGLRVPAARASFYFKNRQMKIEEIARDLNVSYVLDGSVRKSGATLRVAARLVRADDGFIVWSETYDRSWDDMLMIQDDIAGQVAEAIRTSIDSQQTPTSATR